MTKAVLPYFRERKAGHIVQVTSIAGRIGPAGRAPYAAAKFGVEGFSESLSREVRPFGVKVTIVEPGGFRTDFAGTSTKLSEGRVEYDSNGWRFSPLSEGLSRQTTWRSSKGCGSTSLCRFAA